MPICEDTASEQKIHEQTHCDTQSYARQHHHVHLSTTGDRRIQAAMLREDSELRRENCGMETSNSSRRSSSSSSNLVVAIKSSTSRSGSSSSSSSRHPP